MIKRSFLFPSLLVTGYLLLAACVPPASPAQPASTPICPPIQSPASVSVPGEITKITILAGTNALNDPGTGAWCDTSQLKLVKVSVSGLVSTYGCFTDRNDKTYPCSKYNALAAVNIEPSRVKFPKLPRPVLVYDLSKPENKPYCMEMGSNCGGYMIYQLKDNVPAPPSLAWLPVSSATWIPGPAAEGKDINHFSTFALVELPPLQTVPANLQATMIVASRFLPDEPGTSNIFSVAFLIRDAPDMGMNDQTRIFRFSNPEMKLSVSGTYPAECLDTEIYPTVPEQLTCLFPIDMEVILVNGADGVASQISIAPVKGDYEARFFATLEVH